ncbi:MAG TPA: tripartite tricarboxylate transporter substrate binding protein [Caldimonas sp.]|jgi:tripartite-type tricarboxylate transporter receptor subunit TctC|nr:tripartite tricarboxylate transporter substrate binding protein [Caldimonas sp.]HEX2543168.1 tripartite tricarboxylate transporter substrate binding protein [Caldimonas sp.]
MIARTFVTLLALAFALAFGAGSAFAQGYPSRPIRVLHGFQAGGPPDVVLRQIAAKLERQLGQPVVVENRPGASGTVAATAVARGEPDGHLLLFGVAANLAVAPATMKTPPYDPVRAFTPIVEVARGPYLWLVRSDSPAKTMPEFIAWAKSQPRSPAYASPGQGSVHHLATEMLKQAAAVDLLHVPYTGGLYTALLSGQVDAMFESMPGPIPHLASGKLRAIAVTGIGRLAALPDVPTLAEQGIAGIDVSSWWGFVGPAGLPDGVVATLNKAVREALAEPDLRAALEKMGIAASPGTAAAFGAQIAEESARWQAIVARSGWRPE